MLYYNLQKHLTKQEIEAKPLAATLNIYKAIEITAPVHVYLHTYQYKDHIDQIIAFAITVGCDVTLNIESINQVVQIQKYKQIRPAMYRFENKDPIYNHIREILQPLQVDILRAAQEIDYLRDKQNNSKYFQVTDEIEDFITKYAPAYGIPLPKFHATETTYVDYLPKQWMDTHDAIMGKGRHKGRGVQNPEKALAKWDDTERSYKQPTPLYQIERIFDSLMFYVRNGIPFNDNFTTCPQCGGPMRTNPWGMTELSEYEVCLDCDPDPNRTQSESTSFNEAYMTHGKDECGRKITTERNVLDA